MAAACCILWILRLVRPLWPVHGSYTGWQGQLCRGMEADCLHFKPGGGRFPHSRAGKLMLWCGVQSFHFPEICTWFSSDCNAGL